MSTSTYETMVEQATILTDKEYQAYIAVMARKNRQQKSAASIALETHNTEIFAAYEASLSCFLRKTDYKTSEQVFAV
jgi:hypothetical protein